MTRLVPLLAVAAALLAGCRDTRLAGKGCAEDKDCGTPVSAYRCEALTGACYCRTDVACPGAQFCNTAGFCQDRAGCEKNADCLDSSLVCDTASGQCERCRGQCARGDPGGRIQRGVSSVCLLVVAGRSPAVSEPSVPTRAVRAAGAPPGASADSRGRTRGCCFNA